MQKSHPHAPYTPHTPRAPHSPHPPHTEKVYVKVTSDFDTTGYMQPRSITWDDGRVFNIDTVQDFRPASFFKIDYDDAESDVPRDGDIDESNGAESSADCYTVIIQGETRHLFFERSDPSSTAFGRWFVEQTVV